MEANMKVTISAALPYRPSPGEEARRIVRHGMADVLEWLGEEVGPRPDQQTHAHLTTDGLLVSRELHNSVTSTWRALVGTVHATARALTALGLPRQDDYALVPRPAHAHPAGPDDREWNEFDLCEYCNADSADVVLYGHAADVWCRACLVDHGVDPGLIDAAVLGRPEQPTDRDVFVWWTPDGAVSQGQRRPA